MHIIGADQEKSREELEEMSSLYNPQAKICEELEKSVHEQEEIMKAIQKQLDEQLSINYIQLEKCNELQTTKEKQAEEIAQLLQELEECPTIDNGAAQKASNGATNTQPQLLPHLLLITDWKVGVRCPYTVAKTSSAAYHNFIFCAVYNRTSFVCQFDVQFNHWTQFPKFRYNNLI